MAEGIPLPKHDKYKSQYKPNEVYWGLGLENETYFEIEGGINMPVHAILENQKRERYSLDYYTIYKPYFVDRVLRKWSKTFIHGELAQVSLPLLLNSHTLSKTDRFGTHKTFFNKENLPNPEFIGKTILEELADINPKIFGTDKDVWWTLDGDTVEFMTQKYYCATVETVVGEFLAYKFIWLDELNKGLRQMSCFHRLKPTIRYPTENYGMAVYLSNLGNLAIFNNGTYHFNITLPTQLDNDAHIKDWALFLEQHRRLARIFQWMEPFFVSRFGSGDVFSKLAGPNISFPAGSQRVAASRYVSLGTYDTELMKTGKILTEPYVYTPGRWYEQLYDISGFAYKTMPSLGLDINFNKHWNHGLEFRMFDWFPEQDIPNLLRMLVWMCDEALAVDHVADPRKSIVWNNVAMRCVLYGNNTKLTSYECAEFGYIFRCYIPDDSTPCMVYDKVWSSWKERWNSSVDSCTSKMTRIALD